MTTRGVKNEESFTKRRGKDVFDEISTFLRISIRFGLESKKSAPFLAGVSNLLNGFRYVAKLLSRT